MTTTLYTSIVTHAGSLPSDLMLSGTPDIVTAIAMFSEDVEYHAMAELEQADALAEEYPDDVSFSDADYADTIKRCNAAIESYFVRRNVSDLCVRIGDTDYVVEVTEVNPEDISDLV